MSNFSFLLKLSLMQLVFVGMAMIPLPGLASLLSVEALYLFGTLVVYLKQRHLKSILILIPKVVQSLLLLAIEILLLVFYSQLKKKDYALAKSQQSKLGTLIFISNIVEYVLLGLYILVLVTAAFKNRRRQKMDSSFKKHIAERNSILVYRNDKELNEPISQNPCEDLA